MHSRFLSRLAVVAVFGCFLTLGLAVLKQPGSLDALDTRSWTGFCQSSREIVRKYFGCRKLLREKLALTTFRWLRQSLVPEVRIGDDGWFFFADAASRKSMQRSPLFSDKELKLWAEALQERQTVYAKFGTQLWLMLPPDKHSIYGSALPGKLVAPGEGRLKQLADYLREHTTVPVVEIAQRLRDEAEKQPVFFRRDTHWNTVGQAIAYQALIASLKTRYPSLSPHNWQGLKTIDLPALQGDLSNMASLQSLDLETGPVVQWPLDALARPGEGIMGPPLQGVLGQAAFELEKPDAQLEHLFIFGDSFAERLLPVAGQHFKKTNFWRTHQFDDLAVTATHPEAVIFEIVERFLYESPPPMRYQEPTNLLYAKGFGQPERGDVGLYRWMGRRGEVKVQSRDVPMQLSFDIEGALFEVAVDGRVLGQVNAMEQRIRASFELLPARESSHIWRSVEFTALSPMEQRSPPGSLALDALNASEVAGRLFAIGWHEKSL